MLEPDHHKWPELIGDRIVKSKNKRLGNTVFGMGSIVPVGCRARCFRLCRED